MGPRHGQASATACRRRGGLATASNTTARKRRGLATTSVASVSSSNCNECINGTCRNKFADVKHMQSPPPPQRALTTETLAGTSERTPLLCDIRCLITTINASTRNRFTAANRSIFRQPRPTTASKQIKRQSSHAVLARVHCWSSSSNNRSSNGKRSNNTSKPRSSNDCSCCSTNVRKATRRWQRRA